MVKIVIGMKSCCMTPEKQWQALLESIKSDFTKALKYTYKGKDYKAKKIYDKLMKNICEAMDNNINHFAALISDDLIVLKHILAIAYRLGRPLRLMRNISKNEIINNADIKVRMEERDFYKRVLTLYNEVTRHKEILDPDILDLVMILNSKVAEVSHDAFVLDYCDVESKSVLRETEKYYEKEAFFIYRNVYFHNMMVKYAEKVGDIITDSRIYYNVMLSLGRLVFSLHEDGEKQEVKKYCREVIKVYDYMRKNDIRFTVVDYIIALKASGMVHDEETVLRIYIDAKENSIRDSYFFMCALNSFDDINFKKMVYEDTEYSNTYSELLFMVALEQINDENFRQKVYKDAIKTGKIGCRFFIESMDKIKDMKFKKRIYADAVITGKANNLFFGKAMDEIEDEEFRKDIYISATQMGTADNLFFKIAIDKIEDQSFKKRIYEDAMRANIRDEEFFDLALREINDEDFKLRIFNDASLILGIEPSEQEIIMRKTFSIGKGITPNTTPVGMGMSL